MGDTAKPQLVSDDDTLAGIVHLMYFAGLIGLVVVIVVWSQRGKQNATLAFQCAQALILHGLAFLMSILLGIFIGVMVVAVIIEAASESGSANGESADIWGGWIVVFVGAIGVFQLLWLTLGGASIYLAVRCFQHHNPKLPVVGNLAQRTTRR